MTEPFASLEERLRRELSATHVQIDDESHKHRGHLGYKAGIATHLRVVVVATAFEGKTLVARHRMVNALFAPELAGDLHALSIVAKTPEEWSRERGA